MGEINKEMKLVDDFLDTEMLPTRNGYGKGLLELCETNPDVLVMDADLAKSTRTVWVREKYPEKFVEMGIAEQDMLATAGGLSLGGKIPFCSTYGVFVAGRAWDQIRTTICYGDLNVKIGGAHGGVSVGPDGATHQSLEEIPLMRVLPRMTVLAPCDFHEAKKCTIWAAEHIGPVYIRLGREAIPIITTEETPFNMGEPAVYRSGEDVAIIAMGPLVREALLAAERLEEEGVDAMVINCHTIKPMNRDVIVDAAKKCGAVVTAEEASIFGGLGGAVAEVLSQNYPVPMSIIGIRDRFGESGQPEKLLEVFGMNADNIYKKTRELLKMKG